MRIEEIYLNSLLSEIGRVKERGGKGIYRINDKIEDRAIDYVRNYFLGSPEYDAVFYKCPACLGTWDVTITFKG